VNMRDLARQIAKHEGKKIGVNIAQISEIMGLVADCFYADQDRIIQLLYSAGKRRCSRRARELARVLRLHKKAKRK